MRTILTAALSLVLLATSAKASILSFDGIGTTGTGIPNDYGDRVTSALDPGTGYQYGEGNGFTPNIVVDYIAAAAQFSLWPSDYGSLLNVLSHASLGVPGEVVLTPDPGFNVRLNSFDVAGWRIDQQGQVRVLDAGGTVLYDSGNITVLGATSPGFSTFPDSPIVSGSALRIELFYFGTLGLDNVNFDQTVVPIPAALPLLGSALVGLAFVARRRKNPA